MESFPTSKNSNENLQETFGLTLEELEIAEREFASFGEIVQILLVSTIVYQNHEPKKYMINHLKAWKKRFSKIISNEDVELAFNSFTESIFVDIGEKYNVKTYKIKENIVVL